MKKLIILLLVCATPFFSLEVDAKKGDPKTRKSIPIDGGLALFIVAGGAAGISALRKKK